MTDPGFDYEFEGADPDDPYFKARADQLGAMLRDKVRLLILAVAASEFDNLAHAFKPFPDGDIYRVEFVNGGFFLVNLSVPDERVVLNLERLGVVK